MAMTTSAVNADPTASGGERSARHDDDAARSGERLIHGSPSVSSESKHRNQPYLLGNNSTGHSGRGRSQRFSWARSPDRLKAWTSFTSQLSDLQQKRVKADEARRRTRSMRTSACGTFKTLETLLREEAAPRTGPAPGLLGFVETLSQDLIELDAMESRLEAFEEELVAAEFALSRILPRIDGSEAEKTRQMLKQNQIDFREGSYSSGESGRSDPELNPEYQSKLAVVNDVEQQALDLQAKEIFLRETESAALDEDSLAFLQAYPQEYSRLLDELAAAMSELEQLRDKLNPTQQSANCSPRAVSEPGDVGEVNSNECPDHTGFEFLRVSSAPSALGP